MGLKIANNLYIIVLFIFFNVVLFLLALALGLIQAGKFDTVPTLINLVAAFTSIGLVRFSGFKI